MRGISFQYTRPITPPDPNRMDIACFTGFVPRRASAAVPQEIVDWLDRYRWLERAALDDYAMSDVPVPIESWESFDQLFAWEQRLDRTLVISSAALAETIVINADNQLFKLVIDGEAQELLLSIGDHSATAIASFLDQALANISVTVNIVNDRSHLVFQYQRDNMKGQITIFTHPALGFPRAVNSGNDYLDCYLGAAVRAYFSQGGRKCYVIRMGDPLPLLSTEEQRVQQLGLLLTGQSDVWSTTTQVKHLVNSYIPQITLAQERQDDWHGVGHLLGLSDVSYLCLPDLPELLARTSEPDVHASLPPAAESFVECSPSLAPVRDENGAAVRAPRCDNDGYQVWSRVINRLIRFVRGMVREVHIVASLPLPADEINKDFKSFALNKWFTTSSANTEQDIRSAFLQLCYPWLKTSTSDLLPDQAVPAEGLLTGMLAANALTNGVFNSAAGTNVFHAHDLYPTEFFTPSDETTDTQADFYQHISVFARVPDAIQLLSDVTTSADENYRPAVVSRLMALIVRAARNQGRSTLFEPMSYSTWRAIEKSLSMLLMSIFNAGGLRGGNAAEAFAVQCNASTMTQNDIDNGRLIANVSFQPSIPVQRIQVALAVEQGGQVVLQGAA